ncbi:DUF2971 domain-containing protein [Sphingobacterium spiritivorum]|uniref:DUF2971 domain-containing protein n=1 Tax=Sphingobacterium spiritivorum TaxID=258 RepID=UPI00191A7CFC|nr:DUF2971 domain-containing protein [Sphingobacterium spiritivorum]QQT27638.1 DUF2971 domain-containing protein [Sphingobacterium spiritivorum]
MQRYYQDTFLRLSKDLSDNVIKIGDQNAWDKYNFFLTMDSEERNEMLLRMTNETIKSFGICCLTHRFDNDRMWSDYANNGNGICIEYDSQMLINELKKYFRKLNAPYMTGKTLYIDEIERVHYYLGDVSGEGDDDFFKMSAINWMFVKEQEKYQFEEEYRFVFPVFSHNESGFSLVNVSPNVVKKVLIGQRVSSSNREKIIHLIKRKYYGKPDIVYI